MSFVLYSFPMRALFQHDLPDDWPPYLRIRKSGRARRLALRMDSKERVFTLVVPRGVSLARAKDFAAGYDRWMREKLAELPERTPFAHGEQIPVLGVLRRIVVERDEGLRQTRIELEPRALVVRTYLEDPSVRIIRFLKAHAKEVMEPLVLEKAAEIGKRVRSVSVRDTKSRWGSCSHDGKVSLSWRLILAPYEAMDYVIAHEVAHLKHLNHGARFWDLCESLSDDYEEGRGWMRDHAQELMGFG